MASGNKAGKNIFTSIFYASFVKWMSSEPFVLLFMYKQCVHGELAREAVFIFTVDFLELWKFNFFNSTCLYTILTPSIMKFYGKVKHLYWRAPVSVKLDKNAWIGHTSHLIADESHFYRFWKRALGVPCYSTNREIHVYHSASSLPFSKAHQISWNSVSRYSHICQGIHR